MYPRGIVAVCLCILTLMFAQIIIVMNVIHKTLSIIGGLETEFTFINLFISRNINSIILIAICIHIIRRNIRSVYITTWSFVNKTKVITALIMDSCRSNQAIRSYILRVMKLDVVRSLHSRNIVESRLWIWTWHACHFLIDCMSVSSHQVNPISRLSIQCYGANPSIAFGSVLQYKSTMISTIIIRIDRTVVNTIKASKATNVGSAPVGDIHGIHCLIEDTFYGNREGEGYRNLIVDGQRGLPHLRHFELTVNSSNFRRHGSLFWSDIGREA